MSGPRCLPKVYSGLSPRRAYAFLFFIWMASIYSNGLVNGMRITSLSAPKIADLRDNLILECKFDTGGEQLFAVKWYKDEQEFFRYKPLGSPSEMSFPVAGVHLRGASSNCSRTQCRVVLDHLSRDHSGGTYRCEVSGEAPAFRIASESHNVTAAALPIEDLTIENLQSNYQEGEVITADCISAPSDPAPLLSWYMNGYQALRKYVGEMNSSKPDPQGLIFRSLTIKFVADKKLFPNEGRMELSCRSTLPGISIDAQVIEKVILLKSHNSQTAIKNQKLHWLSSSSNPSRISIPLYTLIITMIVLSTFIRENLLLR
ncbi:uncharacterized protein [Onthophagus taurus]|uniref:uncharacterized protein isoform X1 n=2 Tax=Onthophagus taurus TaxID=166361 RepID=UPI0039BDFB49